MAVVTFKQTPGDSYTANELKSFKQNYRNYVHRLDRGAMFAERMVGIKSENDGLVPTMIEPSEENGTKNYSPQETNDKDMEKGDSFSMHTRLHRQDTKKKEENRPEDVLDFDNIDSEKDRHFLCTIGTPAWYMNTILFKVLSFLAISAILKIIIDMKTKKKHVQIKKVY